MTNSRNALYTVAAIRRVEQTAAASLPPGSLMQRAGHAAAKLALSLLPKRSANARVLVLAGPGNNGGDAFVLASEMMRDGINVTVLFDADPEKLPVDAREAYAQATLRATRFERFSTLSQILETQWDIVVDGLFGVGLSKPIASPYRELIAAVNRMPCPILALDIPSGLDADFGWPSPVAVRATVTVTFLGLKQGLFLGAAVDHCGELDFDGLELPATLAHAGDRPLIVTVSVGGTNFTSRLDDTASRLTIL